MFSYRNCAYRFTKSSQCYGNVTVDDGGNVAVDDAGDDVDEVAHIYVLRNTIFEKCKWKFVKVPRHKVMCF